MNSPPRQHPSAATLEAFGQGRLGSQEAQALEEHLRSCAVCCRQLIQLPDDYLVRGLRQAAALPPATPLPRDGTVDDRLAVRCPNPACGKAAVLPGSYRGQTVRCGRCGQKFRLSSPPRGASKVLWSTSAAAGPARIGRFVIQARLGSGGFGDVYRAHDPRLDRDVALKVPRPGMLNTPDRVERFLREARAAARLNHPRIVSVHEAGQDGDQYYIASAFIPGCTLADAVAGGPLDCRRAARLVAELADALAYAHSLGIVHRDVKPANVMLDEQDQPHLTDFGLAHRQDLAGRLTQDGAILGTPAYMAPEHARGGAAEAQPASDQYGLGAVLFELLTGRPPFEGDPPALLYQAVHTEPTPPRRLNPAVRADLETVCLKALAKEPAARYAGCRELGDDLRRWLGGEPIKARPLGPVERCLRWCRRERKLVAAAAAVAACLLVAAGVTVAAAHLVASAGRDRDALAEQARQDQAREEARGRHVDEHARLIRDAQAALDRRQYDDAIAAAERAAAVPDVGDERVEEARELAEKARVARADSVLAGKETQRLWDGYRQALANGRQALAQKDFDAAAKAFGLARAVEPKLVARDRLKLEECQADRRLQEVEKARADAQVARGPRPPLEDPELADLWNDWKQALADGQAAQAKGDFAQAEKHFRQALKREPRLVAGGKLRPEDCRADARLKDLTTDRQTRCRKLVREGNGLFGTLRYEQALDRARAALDVDDADQGAQDLLKKAGERLWAMALGRLDFDGAGTFADKVLASLPNDADASKWKKTTRELAAKHAARLRQIADEDRRRKELLNTLTEAHAEQFQAVVQEAMLEDAFRTTVDDLSVSANVERREVRHRLRTISRLLWPLAVARQEALIARFVTEQVLEAFPDDDDALKWQRVNAALFAVDVALVNNAVRYQAALEEALLRNHVREEQREMTRAALAARRGGPAVVAQPIVVGSGLFSRRSTPAGPGPVAGGPAPAAPAGGPRAETAHPAPPTNPPMTATHAMQPTKAPPPPPPVTKPSSPPPPAPHHPGPDKPKDEKPKPPHSGANEPPPKPSSGKADPKKN
jgi:hypothetical protein